MQAAGWGEESCAHAMYPAAQIRPHGRSGAADPAVAHLAGADSARADPADGGARPRQTRPVRLNDREGARPAAREACMH